MHKQPISWSKQRRGPSTYIISIITSDARILSHRKPPRIGVVVNIAVFFLHPNADKTGRQETSLHDIITVLVCIPYTILYFLPQNDLVLIITLISVSGGLATITGTLGWAMLPDCVEYGEWRTGVMGEGTISSSLTFATNSVLLSEAALTWHYSWILRLRSRTGTDRKHWKPLRRWEVPLPGCWIYLLYRFHVFLRYHREVLCADHGRSLQAEFMLDKSTLKP